MQVKDLTPNAKNPRTITAKKRAMLKKALAEFGDLSGIIYNRISQQLVGGHQRKELFDPDAVIVISKKFGKPTKTGTVAEGYIELNGERHNYREVMWKPAKEKAAMLAANKHAGEWDFARLAEHLSDLSSFDTDFNIDLTMFETDEIAKLPLPVVVEAHTRTPGAAKTEPEDDDEDTPKKPAKCKAGEIYALGETKLLCGADDLHFCDQVIAKWEKQTGLKAEMTQRSKIKKKAAKQVRVQVSGQA